MNVTIMILCRHDDIRQTILRLINSQKNWVGTGAGTDQEALTVFRSSPPDVVLMGAGIDEKSERWLTAKFKKVRPSVAIVRHYGGGSGLLFNEILEALNNIPGRD